MEPNPAEYRFDALDTKAAVMGRNSLCYLVALVDSPSHKISDILSAKRILSWVYEIEEQAPGGNALKEREQSFYSRFFAQGYQPQTPCMVVKSWSPIAAMLERGFKPLLLARENKSHHALATGIWAPLSLSSTPQIEAAKTAEELFWAIMAAGSAKASEQKMWISIIAQPGWTYESAIASLPKWSADEISASGRILWKRTPEG